MATRAPLKPEEIRLLLRDARFLAADRAGVALRLLRDRALAANHAPPHVANDRLRLACLLYTSPSPRD